MAFLKTSDGIDLFYKDEGQGQPILFSHGWPLSADAWATQMLFFGQEGYRVIAHDRRSHGRSTQSWTGNNMDRYADDLHELIEHLDLKDAVLIGHSTGGGEVAHYIGRHGTSRVAKAVLVGAVPPLMLKTPANPDGVPLDVFDGIRAGTASNRSQFFQDLAVAFYGFNRAGVTPSQGLIDSFWLQGMAGGLKGLYDCIHEFSEVDYTEDLKKMTLPTLILHGEDDQIVPLANSGAKAARIAPQAQFLVYPEASHGLVETHPEKFFHDVLDFIRA